VPYLSALEVCSRQDASLYKSTLRTPPGAAVVYLCDSGARYKCHDLLTYLLGFATSAVSHATCQWNWTTLV